MEITVNDIKTRYQVFGEGDPLLILHGWGSNSDRWVVVAEKLAESKYKVIVPDLPGFGESSPLTSAWTAGNYMAWVENFIKEINLKEFYLLGHSFGGALAVKLSIKRPQDVKKLFLVSSAAVRKHTNKKKAYKFISKITKIFSFLPGYKFFRKAVYRFIIKSSDYTQLEGHLKNTFLNIISEDLSQFTGFIKTSTVIIWGDKDKATPIQDAYILNKKIRGSKLIIIPGAGHILNKECPEVLVEKILSNI